MRLEDFVDEQAMEALNRPTRAAEGLPGAAYGQDFFELEQRALFPKLWAGIAVGAQLPDAGELLPVELAGQPLLLVRGPDGAVRCFHNICRHRAMRLVEAPCEAGARITCPWHAWSYDLEGRLAATPNLGGMAVNDCEAFERSALGLKAVRCETWQDVVFVNLDGKAPALVDYLAAYRDTIADYDLTGLRHGFSLSSTYPANWKVFVEGGVEDYHLPWGHPEMIGGTVSHQSTCQSDRRTFVSTLAEQVYKEADTPRALFSQELPEALADETIPLLPHAARLPTGYYIGHLLPTTTLVIDPEEVAVVLIVPLDGETTRLDLHIYYLGDAASDEAHAAMREHRAKEWRIILDQDLPYATGVQKNAPWRDKAGIRTRFSPYWEHSVRDFQHIVVNTIRSGIS